MKNLLITSAVLAAFATPSLAVELGNGFAYDTTLTAEYSVEADTFTTPYEGELNYDLAAGLKAYADTTVDLQELDFTGVDLGLEYVPAKFDKLTITTEAQFDADLEYSDLVVTAELEF